ncbi:MAG: nuclease-related domain-containing protein [Chloroflexota bacterium]
MVVLRDEKRVARLARLGQVLSLAGLATLVLGLLVIFIGQSNLIFIYQLVALAAGFALSQIGLYYTHRYQRQPRPDEVLDRAAGKYAHKNGRMYHYELPADHVLLLPSAVIVFITKFQGGNITANGDNWQQTGLGLRGWFGQERLGNPTNDADKAMGKMRAFIASHAPEAVDVPFFPIIVFTSETIGDLDVAKSNIPAMYHKKLTGYLRQRKDLQKAMPIEAYDALREAFDAEAANLIEETVDQEDSE